MKCPKCQFENPEGIIFCGKCASKLEFICPKCNFSNPPDFVFCGKCAHNLTTPSEASPKDLSFDEKLTKIQKYLPKGLTEKILSQRDRIEGERKQVTVMFCDMEGFTALSEKLGPEAAYSIMDQVYEILIHKVHDYEGTVNEMTGDGIMALFGAPIALEDAPQRAIRSSLAIHRGLAKFNDRTKQEVDYIPPIKMRIGIHTGPVVVGTLGNDLRVEFKAVGDTVNLASRIEELAEAGTTFVTEDTFKITEGLFRFEALGLKQIKGKEEPINIYQVIAPSTLRTRFDVSAERGLTPFVGRARELELLLDGFERAKEGRGQAFSLISEAGVGKSRLLYEFRKAVINENVTFLEGKCLSYIKNVAYHPVTDILKSNFDIKAGDTEFEIKARVTNGLNILGVDEASTLPYILELLPVKDSGIKKIPMSPEAMKDRIIEAVKRITLNGSEIRPLIIAIEDLHWIDKSSEEYLKQLLDNISGARIFLIFTHRPEFVHTWGSKSYLNQINLNRLSNRESLAMVSHILGTEALEKDLEELILEKTEGIPFFIEEFLRSLKDLEVIQIQEGGCRITKSIRDLTIPSGIQNIIMARIDKLSEGAKEVLQTGSVIEREFKYELISHVLDVSPEQILTYISELKDSELLYERGIFPDSTFVFKHSLIREVIFDSLLSKRKKQLHEKIGRSIETLYKEKIEEYYGVLAQHFSEAENHEKGAEYSLFNMRRAQLAALWRDAIEHGKKRLRCLENLHSSEDAHPDIIEIRAKLAGFYTAISTFSEAKELISPILDAAQKLNIQKVLPAVYLTNGLYALHHEENYEAGANYLKKVLEFERDPKSYFFVWMANYNLGWHHSWNCRFEKGFEYYQRTLDQSTKINDPVGISWSKGTMSAMNYAFQGKILQAQEMSKQAIEISEKSGDIFAKTTPEVSRGLHYYLEGQLEKAEDSLKKGLAVCEKTGVIAWLTWTLSLLGDLYSDLEKFEKALSHYQRAIDIVREIGFWPSTAYTWKISAEKTKVLSGTKSLHRKQLLEIYRRNNLELLKGPNARHIAEILLYSEDPDFRRSKEWVVKAINIDEKNGAMWQLGRDWAFFAKLNLKTGDRLKANENIRRAIKIFKDCCADGWVEKYEKELSTI